MSLNHVLLVVTLIYVDYLWIKESRIHDTKSGKYILMYCTHITMQSKLPKWNEVLSWWVLLTEYIKMVIKNP